MIEPELARQIDAIYHQQARRVYATLVRLLGDMDLAEDMLQEAFKAAASQWPKEGIPENPRAWLVSVGRFKAVDQLRRQARFAEIQQTLVQEVGSEADDPDDGGIEDDRLRLIFTCCHPALAPEVRVALTLREVCGLTTEAIAAAFLVAPTTLAQRLVRGKAKIKKAGIPYSVPGPSQLPERLESVLAVIYLVFNEGYKNYRGHALTHADLCQEAIRTARLLLQLLPDAEVRGLLALMLLHESRRGARFNANGELILLEEQDRSLWHANLIAEAQLLLAQAWASGEVGSYCLEAAIANEHASAASYQDTDWPAIVRLYEFLLQTSPSPVIELNRAVAIAMADGPEAGLARLGALEQSRKLENYHLLYATCAELHRRLGQKNDARRYYEQALQLTVQEAEQKFIRGRLKNL